MRYIIHCS